MLDQLYQKNKDYFDALNIYIAAGELKAEELRTQIIPEAMKKAEESGDQMDVQIVNDYNQFLDRLEKEPMIYAWLVKLRFNKPHKFV